MTDLFRLSTGIGLQVKSSYSRYVRTSHRGSAGDDGSGVAIVHVAADCNSRRVQRDTFPVVRVRPPHVILIRCRYVYYLRHSARTQLAGIYSMETPS